MILYQKMKTFLVDNKRRFAFIAAGVVVFLVGYGTGRFALLPLYNNGGAPKNGVKSSNYTTSTGAAPNGNGTGKAAASPVKPGGDPACPIKGNMASTKEKKYYTASDRGYAQVKPEQCFKTEAEALAAGFVAAANPK
jgi:hypothetical protein